MWTSCLLSMTQVSFCYSTYTLWKLCAGLNQPFGSNRAKHFTIFHNLMIAATAAPTVCSTRHKTFNSVVQRATDSTLE